jgi:hypothetical protein
MQFKCKNASCGNVFEANPANARYPDVFKIKCPSCGYLNEYAKKSKPAPIQTRVPGSDSTSIRNSQPVKRKTEILVRGRKVDANIADPCSWLVEIGPDNKFKQSYALKTGTSIIGRQGGNNSNVSLTTDDLTISRSHAVIECYVKDAQLRATLTDFPSKNGLWLNNNKLMAEEKLFLLDGDLIAMGAARFRFVTVNVVADESGIASWLDSLQKKR